MKLPLPSELKLGRKQAGLTQVQLAAISGVSQSVIAKIENGQVDPAYSTVQKLFAGLEKTAKGTRLVSDVMHRGVEVASTMDLLALVSRKMKRLGVSQLPVVLHGSIVGLVSEDDVMRAIERGEKPLHVRVKQVMSASPPTISSTAPASVLSSILHFSPIVCVVQGSKLVGVVTRADLLTIF